MHTTTGKYAEAERLFIKCIDFYRATAARGHPQPETLSALSGSRGSYSVATGDLATLYVQMGRFTDAEKLRLESLATARETFGDDHTQTALSRVNLAELYRQPGSEDDDGILAAAEVSALDLRGVDLAVLSACQTAQGDFSSDGLLGLQRAFQLAGARTTICSLWAVDDDATQTLMSLFYRNLWEKKMVKLDALRHAQWTMLHHYDPKSGRLRGLTDLDSVPQANNDGLCPPRYWAAFVLSGDWR